MLGSLEAHPVSTAIPKVKTTPTLSSSKSASLSNVALWSISVRPSVTPTKNATATTSMPNAMTTGVKKTNLASVKMVLPTFCKVYKPNEMTAKFFDVFPEGLYRQTGSSKK